VEDSREVSDLADSMNWMAAQVDEKIRTIKRQKNEQQAVLASMVEGVIAVDSGEYILNMNRAAAELMHVDMEDVRGRSIREVIRNVELQRFVRNALTSDQPVESDIFLRENGQKFLQAHGTVLHDAGGNHIGALIVLHDVTRLRRLENVRRDFVANVSHELRTPITSIKGFVETAFPGDCRPPGRPSECDYRGPAQPFTHRARG
jgi:two-component system phosphate regulon sensor histidine kinase PhoR